MSPRGGAVASPGGGNWGMFREAWDCNLARNDRNGWGGGGKRRREGEGEKSPFQSMST